MFRAGGYRSVENYLSRIKDLHIREGSGWSVCLERAFRKSKRAVKRGIGPSRQSAALSLETAFKALEDRTHAPVCGQGLVGLRNLIVVGCFWMLRDLEVRWTWFILGWTGRSQFRTQMSRLWARCGAGSACALVT